MLGGIEGGRELMTEGDHGVFEQLCEHLFGEQMRADESLALDMWCALSNVDWTGPNGEEIGYSFRAAGDLVAALRRDGSDYMSWYCCGPDGMVTARIADPLLTAGWTYDILRDW
jgi:hypothetical protein